MSRIVTFNTGRQYSLRGQRIAATILEDGRVMFADVDRGLDGTTHAPMGDPTCRAASIIQSFVMREYDHGRYDYGTEVGDTAQYDLMALLKRTARAL